MKAEKLTLPESSLRELMDGAAWLIESEGRLPTAFPSCQ